MDPAHLPVLTLNTPWHDACHNGVPAPLLEVLRPWLIQQRWWLHKEANSQIHVSEAARFHVDDQGSGAGNVVWWLLIETEATQYQLPLIRLANDDTSLTDNPIARWQGVEAGFLADAWTWPPFAAGVYQHLRAGRNAPALRFYHDTPLPALAPPVDLTLLEQSNSAVRYGDAFFLKVLRVVTPGVHPEEEMGRFLTRRHFAHSLPVLAGVQWNTAQAPRCLAILYAYVTHEGSGWAYMLKGLGKSDMTPWRNAARLLGQRTAELHAVLAQPDDDPSFCPRPYSTMDVTSLRTRVAQRLEDVCRELAILPAAVNGEARGQAAYVVQHAGDLLTAMSHWQPAADLGWCTRIHGDYHLGQVLRRSDGDWAIIDFEGEPLRPLAERRAKDSPLRDVAGMRRSFAYAAAAACLDATADKREGIQHMAAQLCTEFTQGYFDTAGPAAPYLPQAPKDREQLLQLYELEKLLYEVQYELRSRLDWLPIPLGDLYRAARGLVRSDAFIGESKVS